MVDLTFAQAVQAVAALEGRVRDLESRVDRGARPEDVAFAILDSEEAVKRLRTAFGIADTDLDQPVVNRLYSDHATWSRLWSDAEMDAREAMAAGDPENPWR